MNKNMRKNKLIHINKCIKRRRKKEKGLFKASSIGPALCNIFPPIQQLEGSRSYREKD